MSGLTGELVNKLLRYEPDTGKLFWLKRTPDLFNLSNKSQYGADIYCKAWNTRHAFKEAFTSEEPIGYRQGSLLGKKYRAHIIIWLLYYGDLPNKEIDHINGIKRDNRISNLRLVSHAENSRNVRKRKYAENNYHGLWWDHTRNKWQVYINFDGKRIHLGRFADKHFALKVRKEAEKKYNFHPEHGVKG